MRIALTHAYSWPEVRRGAERIIVELSRALAARGHDVTVFTTGARASRTKADGVTLRRARRRFASDARHEEYFGLTLAPRLVGERFDCVHSLGPRDAVGSIRAARVRGHRTVYTNLGNPVRSYWDHHPAVHAHERVVREIDVYGCMSEFSLGLLPTEYGRSGTLTPGGVNLRRFTPAVAREPDPTILFSAALSEKHKGGKTLVDAFGILLQTEPRAQLWLSGPGDPGPTLADVPPRIRDRIVVLELGEPQAQAERYGRAWATALPSKSDSFGLVVVESLACGTPVAASNHAALPELVAPGRTGMLCDPDSPASVAEALAGAIDLSRSHGIVDVCREAAARYDWDEAIAPLYERIYAGAETVRR
jgi:glycosyltransferase involved in cell wall biosynthesis